MAKIISFSNQKGGVGKTTSCVNIAAVIANKSNKKVLMIDMDPQGNATSGLGLQKSKIKKTIYDVIIGRCDIKDGAGILYSNAKWYRWCTATSGADTGGRGIRSDC